MLDKSTVRKRRAKKARYNIKAQKIVRLSVHKTPRHIYAQVIAASGKIIAAASSLSKELREQDFGPGKINIAEAVGALIANKAKENGIIKVAFDRSGFKYHGRVQALADSARNNGLEF